MREAASTEPVLHPVKGYPVCGAKTPRTKHGICCKAAGAGTAHKGYGHCNVHGGSGPNGNLHGARCEASQTAVIYGAPIDIDPNEALLWLVRRTAGIVAWLDTKISESADAADLMQDTGNRKAGQQLIQASVWVEMHGVERDRLARYAKMALDAGVAERHVTIAEQQGRILGEAIRTILARLDLDDDRADRAPGIVREVLAGLPAPRVMEATGTIVP